MHAVLSPILAIALTLGLAACAERGPARPQSPAAPAPAAPAKVAPPPAPEGGIESGAAPAVPPPSPEGQAPAPREPSEADLADCYRYARATIEHDRRIERDRGDAGGFGSLGSDVGAFSDQLSRVGEGSTFQRAYDACMRSKGYAPQ